MRFHKVYNMSEVVEVFGLFEFLKIIVGVFVSLILIQIAWEILYLFGDKLLDFLLFVICLPFILLFMIHNLFYLYVLCNKNERREIKEKRQSGTCMEQYTVYTLHGWVYNTSGTETSELKLLNMFNINSKILRNRQFSHNV